jgi:hypothetical protein
MSEKTRDERLAEIQAGLVEYQKLANSGAAPWWLSVFADSIRWLSDALAESEREHARHVQHCRVIHSCHAETLTGCNDQTAGVAGDVGQMPPRRVRGGDATKAATPGESADLNSAQYTGCPDCGGQYSDMPGHRKHAHD